MTKQGYYFSLVLPREAEGKSFLDASTKCLTPRTMGSAQQAVHAILFESNRVAQHLAAEGAHMLIGPAEYFSSRVKDVADIGGRLAAALTVVEPLEISPITPEAAKAHAALVGAAGMGERWCAAVTAMVSQKGAPQRTPMCDVHDSRARYGKILSTLLPIVTKMCAHGVDMAEVCLPAEWVSLGNVAVDAKNAAEELERVSKVLSAQKKTVVFDPPIACFQWLFHTTTILIAHGATSSGLSKLRIHGAALESLTKDVEQLAIDVEDVFPNDTQGAVSESQREKTKVGGEGLRTPTSSTTDAPPPMAVAALTARAQDVRQRALGLQRTVSSDVAVHADASRKVLRQLRPKVEEAGGKTSGRWYTALSRVACCGPPLPATQSIPPPPTGPCEAELTAMLTRVMQLWAQVEAVQSKLENVVPGYYRDLVHRIGGFAKSVTKKAEKVTVVFPAKS